MVSGNFTSEHKLRILLSAAEERYKSIHLMRERVYKISIWAVGIFLVVVGWIAKEGSEFLVMQKVFITIAVLLASGSVYFYIRDIKKGFDSNFAVLTRIERLLGLYEPGFFNGAEGGLYPEEWGRTKDRPGKFFKYTYLILWTGALIVLFEVWLTGICG